MKTEIEGALAGLDGFRASLQRLLDRHDEVVALEERAESAKAEIEEAARLRAERRELEAVLPTLRAQRSQLSKEVGQLEMARKDVRRMLKLDAA
jgi:hypothetical protein